MHAHPKVCRVGYMPHGGVVAHHADTQGCVCMHGSMPYRVWLYAIS
jgi:hypothetical protein